MKALIVTDRDQDYGADFIYDGLCDLFGYREVLDWPDKPSLHGMEQAVFDCDLAWPRSPARDWSTTRLAQALSDREFGLIVIPTLRGNVPNIVAEWRDMGLTERNADRIVCVDSEDHDQDTRRLYTWAVGFETPYFKREVLPVSGLESLPFGYPSRRIVRPKFMPPRSVDVGYAVHVWDWAVGGTREILGGLLAENFGNSWVQMSYSGKERISPILYHEKLRSCRVAVIPAGMGYFTNRLFEAMADGCAIAMETPSVQFPDALIDGIECVYWRDPVEAVDKVREILETPGRCEALAEASRGSMMLKHTTRERARKLWLSIQSGKYPQT